MKNDWVLYRMEESQFRSLPAEQQNQFRKWLRGLGLDPNRLRACLAITHHDNGLSLNLSEYVLDDRGSKIRDWALDQAVAKPLVVPIDVIPEWLPSFMKERV